MIVWFRRSVLILFVALAPVFSYSPVCAFIPEGAEIIKLAVKTIVEPAGMRVLQKRKIYYEQQVPKNFEEPFEEPGEVERVEGLEENGDIKESQRLIKEENIEETAIGEQEKTELSFTEITEKFIFSFPGKFRAEAVTGSHDMICVESKGLFVKIIDEFIESKEKAPIDLYTDILLYRQFETLQEKLEASGVDINLSSFKRYDDKIYFVVGTPPSKVHPTSSFWVEKDTGFPGRYTIIKDNLFVDIFYKDWQKVSKTWYPMQIDIFLDGTLFSEIKVETFELEADFEKNLFNVKRLMNIFPESTNYKNESGSYSNESDALEKSITEFKKLYE